MLTIKEYITKAIHTKLGITIKYMNNDGDASVRKLSDLEFSDELGDDYIKAFCHLRKEYRTFKISRILGIDSLFNCSEDFSAIPKPSRFWRTFGEEYSLREIWAATSPGLYDRIKGDTGVVTVVHFTSGSESYRIEIPLENGSKEEIKLSEMSDLEWGDEVKISTITGQDNYKMGYNDTISVLRFDGIKAPSNECGWESYGDKYHLKDIMEALTPGLYNQIDGEYAIIKPIKFSNNLAYLRILVPFKDGSIFELKLSDCSNLKDGDEVFINSITGQEFHKLGSKPIIRYNANNANTWTPFGEKKSLKEIWTVANPVNYDQIDGDLAEVIAKELPNSRLSLRIRIPFKNGSYIDLIPSINSYFEEGDEIIISTITGQTFRKKGADSVVFYDGDLF